MVEQGIDNVLNTTSGIYVYATKVFQIFHPSVINEAFCCKQPGSAQAGAHFVGIRYVDTAA